MLQNRAMAKKAKQESWDGKATSLKYIFMDVGKFCSTKKQRELIFKKNTV
jgi:hypothetical protein